MGVGQPPDVFVFHPLNQRLWKDPATNHLLLKPSPTCMKEIGEPQCCHGTSIITGKEVFIGEGKDHLFGPKKKSCTTLKEESILAPAEETYAPLITYIINACKKLKCSDEVTRFRVKVENKP